MLPDESLVAPTKVYSLGMLTDGGEYPYCVLSLHCQAEIIIPGMIEGTGNGTVSETGEMPRELFGVY